MTLTTRLLCPHCGSDDLGRDAVARWDGKAWVLDELLDDIFCCNCGQDDIEPREMLQGYGETHDVDH